MIDYLITMVSGDAPADLAELAAKLEPTAMAAGFKEVLDENFARNVSQRFADEGDATVGKWAPLAESTRSVRAALARQGLPIGPAHPINVRTGGLRDWATSGRGVAGPTGTGWLYTYPSVEPADQLLKKVTTAQEGQTGRVPSRPVLAIGVAEAAQVTRLTGEYLGFAD